MEHPMTEKKSMDTKRIKVIRERLNRASKGPWTACRMTHGDRGDDLTPAELGEYVQNSVVKSAGESGSNAFLFVSVEKTDGKSADVCHVGNGPTSPANADFIAHAPDDIAFLLASLSPVEPTPEPPKCFHCGSRPGLHRMCPGQLDGAYCTFPKVEPAPPTPAPCVWREDDDGQWHTDCGRIWEFNYDGPTENRVNFCHGCGHPVQPVAYVEPTEADE